MKNFMLAIRRNLIIFALCYHRTGMYGLSLIFIIQGVLFVALLILFIYL